MAEISPTKIFNHRNDIIVYEWVLTDNDTATFVEAPHRSDKTIQVSGDFGTSGDIRAEGSIDPDCIVFWELDDPQGNNIAITAADGKTILENVVYIRPKVAAGTGVNVTVRILMS